MVDPTELIFSKRQDLIDEANTERLIALLPRRPSLVRRGLAAGCRRLANVIDAPQKYVRTSEAGPPDWLARSAGV